MGPPAFYACNSTLLFLRYATHSTNLRRVELAEDVAKVADAGDPEHGSCKGADRWKKRPNLVVTQSLLLKVANSLFSNGAFPARRLLDQACDHAGSNTCRRAHLGGQRTGAGNALEDFVGERSALPVSCIQHDAQRRLGLFLGKPGVRSDVSDEVRQQWKPRNRL